MFKVGYEEGDFKGMEAAGSTEEKARKNLKNKILRKLKKEIIESFTSTDIEHLYRCFETTTDDRDEVNNTIDTTRTITERSEDLDFITMDLTTNLH